MRHFTAILVAILVIGTVGWRLWVTATPDRGSGTRGKAPIAIEWAEVTLGDMDDIVEFTGSLAGNAEVLVSSNIAGRVNTVHVDMGDEVEKDRLLVELDEVELQHAVEEANARLAVARTALEELQANLANAESELQRIKTLRERKVASAADMEASEANYLSLLGRRNVAEAMIRQQQAVLQAEKVRLSYTKIHAPISGVVGKRYLDEGAMVSSTTPIVSLADITSVKTTISVVERDYAKIRKGLEASLTVDAYPGRVFKGKVARIAPVLDQDTRSAEVEVEVPNLDQVLKPGMFTRVQINFGTHKNVALIPSRTLVKRDQREGVFVPGEDMKSAQFRVVETVLTSAATVEVIGIEPGQRIVTMGQHLLTDGDSIVESESLEPSGAGNATE